MAGVSFVEQQKIKSIALHPSSENDGELRAYIQFLPAKSFKRAKIQPTSGLVLFKKIDGDIFQRDGEKFTLSQMFEALKCKTPLSVQFEAVQNSETDNATILKIEQ